jgi:superfamily II DNA/RNA helicase
MQALLSALERVRLPRSFSLDVDISTLIDRVHRSYLQRTVAYSGDTDTLSDEDLSSLRRIALYLEAETTISHSADSQTLQDAVHVSASIFEFLAQQGFSGPGASDSSLLSHRLAAGDLADYMRAMMLYSLGRYESNGAVIGRRLQQAIDVSTASDALISDQLIASGMRVVTAFVAGQLYDAIRYGSEFGATVRQARSEWDADGYPLNEAPFLSIWLQLTEACITVAISLQNDLDDVFETGRARLRAAAERAMLLRDGFAFWLADRLQLIAEQKKSNSVYQVLRGAGLPERYVEQLVVSGVCEFWTSQREAIDAGILDVGKSFTVNLPTGAGKSLLAELVIVQSLLSLPGAWGLYLVPSRALVHQVENDLRNRLPRLGLNVRTVIAGAEPVGILDDELEELSAPGTLTVLTPEKLDVYFRNQPDLFSECKLLVVDEAHKIGDAQRGALVDTLLTRFRILVPTARMLLLSAVMSNVFEIAGWLGSPDGAVRSHWRPTRQLKGLVVRYDDISESQVRVVKGKSRTETLTRYRGGVSLVHRPSDLANTKAIEIDLQDMFSGLERTWFNVAKRRRETKGPTATDHAIELAERFARLPGVTVVFLGQKASAEKCAREVAKRLLPITPQHVLVRESFATHLGTILGHSHELPGLVRSGVCYHHAGLPTSVRRAIESALRDGVLRVVCATATLQEGLNTPATTVIMTGLQRRDIDSDKNVDVSIPDFVNIAGRAGRAGRDTEGHIILLPTNLDRQTRVIRDGRRYLFPDDEAFVILSALRAIEEELENAVSVDEANDLSTPAQSVLLALHAAGFASESDLEKFFSATLATRQRHADVTSIASTSQKYLKGAQERHGEDRLSRFSKTALPLSACEVLDSALQSLISSGYDVLSGLRIDGRIASSRLTPLVDALFSVDQFRIGPLSKVDASTTADVLAQWMNGTAYRDLAELPIFKGNIENVVAFIGIASRQLSWGFGSAYLLIDLLAPGAVNQEFGLLPLFVEFGVNEAAAAYVCLLGVSDRDTASALGRSYIRSFGDGAISIWHPFGEVESWLRELTTAEIRLIDGLGEYQRQVLLDDLGIRDAGIRSNAASRLFSIVDLGPDSVTSEQTFAGDLCYFADASGSIQVFGQITDRYWGTIRNPRALYEFAGNDFASLTGLTLRQRNSPTTALDVEVWRR